MSAHATDSAAPSCGPISSRVPGVSPRASFLCPTRGASAGAAPRTSFFTLSPSSDPLEQRSGGPARVSLMQMKGSRASASMGTLPDGKRPSTRPSLARANTSLLHPTAEAHLGDGGGPARVSLMQMKGTRASASAGNLMNHKASGRMLSKAASLQSVHDPTGGRGAVGQLVSVADLGGGSNLASSLHGPVGQVLHLPKRLSGGVDQRAGCASRGEWSLSSALGTRMHARDRLADDLGRESGVSNNPRIGSCGLVPSAAEAVPRRSGPPKMPLKRANTCAAGVLPELLEVTDSQRSSHAHSIDGSGGLLGAQSARRPPSLVLKRFSFQGVPLDGASSLLTKPLPADPSDPLSSKQPPAGSPAKREGTVFGTCSGRPSKTLAGGIAAGERARSSNADPLTLPEAASGLGLGHGAGCGRAEALAPRSMTSEPTSAQALLAPAAARPSEWRCEHGGGGLDPLF